jgi:hypothetical protein
MSNCAGGKMRKSKPVLFLAFVIMALLLANTGCAPQLIAKAEGLADVGDMQREMQLLNLVNDLELRASQMRFIIAKAQEAEKIREELVNRADGNIEEYQAEMTRIAREVKVILEQHQIYALERFVSCDIPPQDEARIGQTDGAIATQEALAQIRTMPDAKFERNKEETAQGIIEHLKSHLPGGSILVINEGEETARILSILDEARGLSDLEFELQKADLIQQVLFAYGLHESSIDTCLKIEQHLLDPRIIPLLEEKLALTVRTVVELG